MGRPMYAQCLEVQIRVRTRASLNDLSMAKIALLECFFFKSTVFLLPLLLANGIVFEHTCVNSVKIRAAAAAKVMGVE